jgi:hypothetical protein
MTPRFRLLLILGRCLLGAILLVMGCAGAEATPTVTPMETPIASPAMAADLPQIAAVALDRAEVPRYESLEMMIGLQAEYGNPYDARQVTLQADLSGPGGLQMSVPGFWDGEASWRVRFTPSREGEWRYRLVVADARGASRPWSGSFVVTSSQMHGWLQPGNWVDAAYSGHYLVHHDGTPFYGIGHGEALNILAQGYDAEKGVTLFNKMREVGENYVVWWPLYSSPPIRSNYDRYSVSDMKLIDLVVQDAQAKGIFLIFTIWSHPLLRDASHEWSDHRWEGYNGFRKLGDIDVFFNSEEAWAWQENFYRYLIARWGYSPAIGMWATVSEINGTNAYERTNPWHGKLNAFFVEHDPYRHPTTASKSGGQDWVEGYRIMDVPQVHVYGLDDAAIKTAQIIAGWTESMWQRAEKPNWVGEFGTSGNTYYPELFHNGIWAGLASGAAMTPAEWNGGSFWGAMTPEMNADIGRLAAFVTGLPLAAWDPSPLQIRSSDPQVRGWGVAGEAGGLFWVQDFSLEGAGIQAIKQSDTVRQGVSLELSGLAAGAYTMQPYDTWRGLYLESIGVECSERQACRIDLPDFRADMAVKFERE